MEIYESHKLEDQRLPFILHDFFYRKGQSLGFTNWHENLELLCPVSGVATVTINGQRHRVGVGEIAVINANAFHDVLAEEDLHFYCLIVDRAFCLSNYFDTSRIRLEPLIRDGEIHSLLHAFVGEYEDSAFSLRVPLLRSTALRILALLCGRYGKEESGSETDTVVFSAIKQVLQYIHAESHRKITLDRLAEVAGLSKYYLAREFHRITGYTVVAYVNHVRCENAKRMMMDGNLSILAISRSCGFPNASYFTRTFSTLVGMRPAEYRARQLRKNRNFKGETT